MFQVNILFQKFVVPASQSGTIAVLVDRVRIRLLDATRRIDGDDAVPSIPRPIPI